MRYFVDEIDQIINGSAEIKSNINTLQVGLSTEDQMAFHSALTWKRLGMKSVFLQDADTLILKPDDLVAILEHLRQTFPQVERVTSYARSHSIARISDGDMTRLAAVGLNRIHVGMESACNEVLDISTLAIPEMIELHNEVKAGRFKPLGDKKKAEEL